MNYSVVYYWYLAFELLPRLVTALHVIPTERVHGELMRYTCMKLVRDEILVERPPELMRLVRRVIEVPVAGIMLRRAHNFSQSSSHHESSRVSNIPLQNIKVDNKPFHPHAILIISFL